MLTPEFEIIVRRLNFYCRQYDSITKIIAGGTTRIQNILPDANPKNEDHINLWISSKTNLKTNIVNTLKYFPVWNEWLSHINGVGPFIGGNLVLMFNYKFVPFCEKCGAELIKDEGYVCSVCGLRPKKKKDGGVKLQFRIEERFFPTVSAFWKFTGLAIVDGKKPKPQKGKKNDWKSLGRQVCFQFGQQILKQKEKNPYHILFEKYMKRREKTHPERSKFWRKNMCLHETTKQFISDFFVVSKALKGENIPKPYIIAKNPELHTKLRSPMLWERIIPFLQEEIDYYEVYTSQSQI